MINVTSIGPFRGPVSGGTEVVIMGMNLDIGTSVSVSVAGHNCEITQYVMSIDKQNKIVKLCNFRNKYIVSLQEEFSIYLRNKQSISVFLPSVEFVNASSF